MGKHPLRALRILRCETRIERDAIYSRGGKASQSDNANSGNAVLL